MRKIILGRLNQNRKTRQRIGKAYRIARKKNRTMFGGWETEKDLIFHRSLWTGGDNKIDFFRHENDIEFRINFDNQFLQKDLEREILRALITEKLREEKYSDDFLSDILVFGERSFLMGDDVLHKYQADKLSSKDRKLIYALAEDSSKYDFDEMFLGYGDLPEGWLEFVSFWIFYTFKERGLEWGEESLREFLLQNFKP